MKTSHGQQKNKAFCDETPSQISSARYLQAFSAARAMCFWRPRVSVKQLTAAAFSAALAFSPSAAHAQSPFSFDIGTVDGSNGFVINGAGPLDRTGVSNAGDVNGDGVDDVIIGSRDESYVVFGQTGGFSSSFDVNTINGTNGFVISNPIGPAGPSVSGAGDVNGDGVDDLIIGAPDGAGPPFLGAPAGTYLTSTESYVVFGQTGGFSPSLNLSTLDGRNGFAINGFASNETAGTSVSGAGDVNGDGFDDVIIGAPGLNSGDTGRIHVLFGQGGGFASSVDVNTLDGTNGFEINDPDVHEFGTTVSNIGDINGDGFADLGIGVLDNGFDLVRGQADGFSATSEVGPNRSSIGTGIDFTRPRPGVSLSGAGDVNGDGFDDFIFGAPLEDGSSGPATGVSFVYFGSDSAVNLFFPPHRLDGTRGFTLSGSRSARFFGQLVSGAGDVNGDGFDDLIVAESLAGIIGTSYLVFGSDRGFSSLAVDMLDRTNGLELRLGNDFDGPASVSGAGDINGDGFDDLVIGVSMVGQSQNFIVFGRESFVIPEPSSTALLGAGLLGWMTRRRRR